MAKGCVGVHEHTSLSPSPKAKANAKAKARAKAAGKRPADDVAARGRREAIVGPAIPFLAGVAYLWTYAIFVSRLAYPLLHPHAPHCYHHPRVPGTASGVQRASNGHKSCIRHRAAGIVILVLFHLAWVPSILSYISLLFGAPGPRFTPLPSPASEEKQAVAPAPSRSFSVVRPSRASRTQSSAQGDDSGDAKVLPTGRGSPHPCPSAQSHLHPASSADASHAVTHDMAKSSLDKREQPRPHPLAPEHRSSSSASHDAHDRQSEDNTSLMPVAPSVRSERSARWSLDMALGTNAPTAGEAEQTAAAHDRLSLNQALALGATAAEPMPPAPSDSPIPNPDFVRLPPDFDPPAPTAPPAAENDQTVVVPMDTRPAAPLPRPAAVVGNWPLAETELWCGSCNAPRPARAHHCRRCGRCVERMDHHCIWINNCVGQGNHRLFWAFLLWTSLMEAFVLAVSIWSLATIRLDGFVISLLPLSFWFLLFTSMLAGMHAWLLAHGMTTMEQMRMNQRKKDSLVRIKVYLGPTGAAGVVRRAIEQTAIAGHLPMPPHRPGNVVAWAQPAGVEDTPATWTDESKLAAWAAVAPKAELALQRALSLRASPRWWRRVRGKQLARKWARGEIKQLRAAWEWEWGEASTVGNAWWVDPTAPATLSPTSASVAAPLGQAATPIRHPRPRGPRVWWANARPVVGAWYTLCIPIGIPRAPAQPDALAALNPRFNPAQGQARPRWAWPRELQ